MMTENSRSLPAAHRCAATVDEIQTQRADKMEKADAISVFLFEISELEFLPIEFSERLWHNMVDHVKVYEDDRLVFIFRNGIKITEFL